MKSQLSSCKVKVKCQPLIGRRQMKHVKGEMKRQWMCKSVGGQETVCGQCAKPQKTPQAMPMLVSSIAQHTPEVHR